MKKSFSRKTFIFLIALIAIYMFVFIENKIITRDGEELTLRLLDENNPMWHSDKDNDNLSDAMETILGTNIDSDDSDKDRLKDEFEIKASLNPNKKDSDSNNIPDNKEDMDLDGNDNETEQERGTDPLLRDDN